MCKHDLDGKYIPQNFDAFSIAKYNKKINKNAYIYKQIL